MDKVNKDLEPVVLVTKKQFDEFSAAQAERDEVFLRSFKRLVKGFAILSAAVIASLGIGGVALDKSDNGLDRVEHLQTQSAKGAVLRQHDICVGAEYAHRLDVRRLKQTYGFIVNPNPGLEALIPAVLPNVTQLEEDAKDRSPRFCNNKVILPLGFDGKKGTSDDNYYFPGRDGVLGTKDDGHLGLPEPDPVIPKRPKEVDSLLKLDPKKLTETMDRAP
jgi:hypothetical protein